ncbi:Monomeric isocitrate dehydrogenase [Halapricum desulfuricans]|uniref:Monomeric isocitrate dehydrogenase n=2 Tax=Halapricum desulfuricans TaxID=2841257 RepID=A0A897NAL7_9EURY|nr:Monomeric isocitrate dehydrogenase [Halapricum desulfuricans]
MTTSRRIETLPDRIAGTGTDFSEKSREGTMTERGISRRAFAKAAVAIGGASALAACLDRGGSEPIPSGPDDLSTLPSRQHAWNESLPTDDHGNVRTPYHHLLLYYDYDAETTDAGDATTPTEGDRETVENALRSLERAYEHSSDGLVFTIGYSRRYFDRYDDSLPESVDLPRPEPLAPFEDPEPDELDAIVHLASDRPEALLEAEEALRGNRETANDSEMRAALSDVLTFRERRTGFIGDGMPAERDDVDGVPEGSVPDDAPMYMGFKSGFRANQATEDRVTIQSGPFEGGTTQHVSKINLHLDQWYEQDSRSQRVSKMFCPAHAAEDRVEGAGHNLGAASGASACPAHADSARESGVVGHAQKNAAAREDGSPIMLRRDFDSTDDDRAGLHFLALQRDISDFVETREAMNGADAAEESGAVGTRLNNGILEYMTVRRRGNYLLPPRPKRALPRPR